MSARIPCSVPFCRRTAAQDKHPGCTEIICYRCWQRGVPKSLRVIYRRAYKAAKVAGERAEAARLGMERASLPRDRGVTEEWTTALPRDRRVTQEWTAAWVARERAYARCHRLWSVCKRRATEAAAGLA